MADKRMDERDRRWRERDWRSPEADRDGGIAGEGYYPQGREDRSFGDEKRELGARRSGPDRDRVFGEQETGASYSRGPSGGYGPRPPAGQAQGRDRQEFGSQDYTQGGRFYGDDDRQRIYREEYGQGGAQQARAPRGYGDGSGGQQGGSYGGAGGDYGYRARPAYGGTSAGGTGGYDYERGYGDGGRGDSRGRGLEGRGDEIAQGAREGAERAGEFLQKTGQKVANWIRGDHLMEGSGGEDRSYRTDFGRERRNLDSERGHRGLGPKGYQRSDERISEEVHERLTDDSWLDASHVNVAVSGGEVTLSGTVESREAKHRAERLVEDLSGVVHVQNNLRITSVNPLTGSGRGFGDNAAEAQMRKDDPAANGSGGSAGVTPGNGAEH